MNKVKIEYSQLLFLYAYLRQIDLSLDRSRWTSWGELQGYFKERLQPVQMIEYLKSNFQLPNTDLDNFVFFPEKKNFITKVKYFLCRDLFLRQNELLYFYKLMRTFDKELKSNNKEYNLNIEKLRINVAEFYDGVLGLMILNKDLNRLMKIEHYEQNSIIEVIEMSEFVPDDF
jgi:hypothetical protein